MRSICLLLATLFLAAAAPPQAREPKFEMERNPTLETLYIMVLLAPSWRTPDMGVRPLADDARKHFAPFANHPSVRLLDRMMREEGSGWITWIQTFSILAVSSPKPVPQASFDPTRIGFPDFAFPKQTVASAAELMEAANRFYRDAHVEEFRRRSEPAYTCAFEHV